MTFDERVLWICKWLLWIALFFGVCLPVQILWFLIFPLIKILTPKIQRNDEARTDLEFFTPTEVYGKLAKRFLAGDV